jgi:hypothetical protein
MHPLRKHLQQHRKLRKPVWLRNEGHLPVGQVPFVKKALATSSQEVSSAIEKPFPLITLTTDFGPVLFL